MRIRFFNTHEPVTTFYRDLLPALAERGMQIEVYVSAVEYRPARAPLAQAIEHPYIKIKSLPYIGPRPKNRWQKAWLMWSYALCAATVSLFSPAVDANYFLSQPPLFAIWGWVLRIFRGQRYFCVLMDLYPHIFVQNGVLKENHLLTRALKALAHLAWKHAEGIIVVGRCQRDRLIREGIPAEKIRFIPNWANDAVAHPISPSRNTLRKQLDLTGSFVVLYSGNMGICHDFQTLLDAAQRLLSYSGIKFVLIGDGARRSQLEKKAAADNLRNMVFLPFQPTERLAESLSLGDVHIVTLRDGFEGLLVPSKVYGAIAVGKPVIYVGSPFGEIARMVSEAGIGTAVPVGDVDGLVWAILQYYRSPFLVKRHGQQALALFKKHYHYKNAIMAYTELLTGRKND